MMPEEVRLRFELWARLAPHKLRVESARKTVAKWLSMVNKPYIAFSGGKDSTCILHLVREQRPDIPAVYLDADCCFPEIRQLLDDTPNLINYPTDEPFLVTLARYGFGAEEASRLDRATMQSTVWGPIKRLIADYGFDGVCYGLRSEESWGRRLHARYRGRIFVYHRDGLIGCQPITEWSYNDVWAYIVANNLPYAGTYDRMWDMPEEDQRVSYWAGETKRHWGRWAWLKHNYPELFNRLAALFPEARSYV